MFTALKRVVKNQVNRTLSGKRERTNCKGLYVGNIKKYTLVQSTNYFHNFKLISFECVLNGNSSTLMLIYLL